LRHVVVVRLLRTGEDAAGDHPPDACRHRRRAGRAAGESQARRARRDPGRLHAGGARRAVQGRDGEVAACDQGRQYQGQRMIDHDAWLDEGERGAIREEKMTMRLIMTAAFGALGIGMLAGGTAQAAEIKVLSTQATEEAYRELVPQ